VLVASHNAHKVHEIRRILEPLGLSVIGPGQIQLALDIEETCTTFVGNALLKAKAYSAASGLPALADDSGLIVDALGGEPGIYSARFGGPDLDDSGRYRLVLDRLRDVPDEQRSARFVAAIALVTPTGQTLTVEGSVEGRIGKEARGRLGFGYDPIFYYPPAGRTFGEMSDTEKDAVSHRGVALRRLVAALNHSSPAGILR
jgi:XTP/dITP diphosphohydrolase